MVASDAKIRSLLVIAPESSAANRCSTGTGGKALLYGVTGFSWRRAVNFDLTEQERTLLLELIENEENSAIQGLDHAESRRFKDLLRQRLAQLASAKDKLHAGSSCAA